MHENLMVSIGLIVILGVVAQWIAWRLRLPSILMLLFFGLLAGPVFGILHPDDVLGEVLFPAVSLSVGVILFEGGLGLNLKNLGKSQAIIRNLVSVGALVTLAVAAPAAHFLLGMDWPLSILLASILVVSGPTVVIPLLRFIRPTGRVSSILRWEGILIDPVGATLAVLAFEAIKAGGEYHTHILGMLGGILMTLLIGGALGAIAAFLLIGLFSRGWVPNYLQTSVALIMMVAMFVFSNSLMAESGLMGATIMGVVLANQKKIEIDHIVEFKEQLGILLLSVLFVVLAARVTIADLAMIGWGGVAFLAVLILIARPLGAWVSTRGSDLLGKEVLFLGWMAPRGIVAMAVASLFGLDLVNNGYPGAELIVPITILVVIGTVIVYALTSGPLARRLNLVEKDPQGVLIVGAHKAARAIARELQTAGFYAALVDTNGSNIAQAQRAGLNAIENSIYSDSVLDQLPLGNIGNLLALTSDSEVNVLASLRFEQFFGRDHVYQLNPNREDFSDTMRKRFHGRYLFQCEVNYDMLDTAVNFGGVVRLLNLKTKEDVERYQDRHVDEEILLFSIPNQETLHIATCESIMELQPGYKVISLQLPQGQLPESVLERITPVEKQHPVLE